MVPRMSPAAILLTVAFALVAVLCAVALYVTLLLQGG
jgi:hypothetical protein